MPILSNTYPINLILDGRPCLVVGGGPVAARKAEGLLACGALVLVVAPEVGEEVRALGEGYPDTLSWHDRPFGADDVQGRFLVIAATNDRVSNRAVASAAGAVPVWVNVADDPDVCTFILPAIKREGPVTVAVSTAGHSPALAGWIRDHLHVGPPGAPCGPDCSPLGPEHAVAARLMAEARDELREAGRSTEGLDWQGALGSAMFTSIRAGNIDQAREQLRECLSLS